MMDTDDEDELRLVLIVDRHRIVASAISQVAPVGLSELQRTLEVRFAGEAAEDAGGPRREFFNEFGRALAQCEGLWQVTPAGAVVPAPAMAAAQHIPNDATRQATYRGCGRIFGMALCQGARPPAQPLLLGLPLAKYFVRAVQGDDIDGLDALQAELNAEQHSDAPDFRGTGTLRTTSLRDLALEGQLMFSCAVPGGGVVDLIPGGRDLAATDETKDAWLRAVLRYELVESIMEAAVAFRGGVRDVVGAAHLALLGAGELRAVWSGRGVVSDEDLRAWQRGTEVSPTVAQQSKWFFELLWGELQDARGRVLKFATGSDRWPVNPRGFKFTVEPRDGGDDALPSAMTCGNMLQLPRYSCRESLRDRLLQAMDWGLELHLA